MLGFNILGGNMEYKCSNCGNSQYKTIENQGGVFLICQKCGYVDELVPRKSQQPIIQEQQIQNVPHCPYCNSTNLKRITTTAKVVNIAMFGLLGNKRKYQWHCDHCGSDF